MRHLYVWALFAILGFVHTIFGQTIALDSASLVLSSATTAAEQNPLELKLTFTSATATVDAGNVYTLTLIPGFTHDYAKLRVELRNGDGTQISTNNISFNPGTGVDAVPSVSFTAQTQVVGQVHTIRYFGIFNPKFERDSSSTVLPSVAITSAGVNRATLSNIFISITAGAITDVRYTPSEYMADFITNYTVDMVLPSAADATDKLELEFPEGTTVASATDFAFVLTDANAVVTELLAADCDLFASDNVRIRCGLSRALPAGRLTVVVRALKHPPNALSAKNNLNVLLLDARSRHRDKATDGTLVGSILAPCVPGSYYDRTNVQCQPCPTDTFSNTTNALTCTPCAVGTFASEPNSTECDECPVGTEGFETLLPTRKLGCRDCPVGKYGRETKATACVPCEVGHYQNQTAQQACLRCDIDYYAPDEGATSCLACDPQKSTKTTGQSTCAYCRAGYHVKPENQDCVQCEVGRYSDEVTDSTACSLCAVGKFQASVGRTLCDDCPMGRAGPDTGASQCVSCTNGEYTGTSGRSTCSVCTAGTYSDAAEATACEDCPAGYFSADKASTCAACAPGEFSSEPKSITCAGCNSGTFAAAEASTVCSSCIPGKYATNSRATTCEPCPIGQYTASYSASLCPYCAAGRFASTTGQSTCEDCPEGQASDEGAAECFDNPDGCKRGEWGERLLSGAWKCNPCELGRYNDQYAQTVCKLCPTGKYASSPSQQACAVCPVGKYADTAGTSDCKDCPAGRYAAYAESSSCSECGLGTSTFDTDPNDPLVITPAVGKSGCDQCPRGKIAPTTAATTCQDCTAGRYSDTPGGILCTECPSNTSTPTAGAPEVKSCQVVSCPSLDASTSANLVVTYVEGVYGAQKLSSLVTYTCRDPTAVLVGPSSRTCITWQGLEGRWTGDEPLCLTPSPNAIPARLEWGRQPVPSIVNHAYQFPTAPLVRVVDFGGTIIAGNTAVDKLNITVDMVTEASTPAAGLRGFVFGHPTDGVLNLPDLHVTAVGTFRLRASCPGFTSVLSNPFTVTRGRAVGMRVITSPRSTARASMPDPVVVYAVDSQGNVVTDHEPISLTVSTSTPNILINTMENMQLVAYFVAGKATFTNVALSSTKTITDPVHVHLTVSSPTLGTIQSAPILLYPSRAALTLHRNVNLAYPAKVTFRMYATPLLSSLIVDFPHVALNSLITDICTIFQFAKNECTRIQPLAVKRGDATLFSALAKSEDALFLRDRGVALMRIEDAYGMKSLPRVAYTAASTTIPRSGLGMQLAKVHGRGFAPLSLGDEATIPYSVTFQLNPADETSTRAGNHFSAYTPVDLALYFLQEAQVPYSLTLQGSLTAHVDANTIHINEDSENVIAVPLARMPLETSSTPVEKTWEFILGMVLGCTGFALIMGFLGYCCCCRKKADDDVPMDYTTSSAPRTAQRYAHPVQATISRHATAGAPTPRARAQVNAQGQRRKRVRRSRDPTGHAFNV